MNGALKKNKTESFSLNNLFSCELTAVTQMDSETARATKTVHNLFLYITKSESGEKKDEKKKQRNRRTKEEKMSQRETRGAGRERL